ncbi:hypothetical protein [Rhodosalinus sp. K401]|uniref:hypothetical protein n=1 Tax=Rhodosalinus sp. K401 TaxID=3239195 RepID=UPI003523D215
MTAIPHTLHGTGHYAALVFPADEAPSAAALLDRLDCWLEQAGHTVRAARLHPSNGAALIETDGFRVTVMESVGETAKERRLAIRLEETGGSANAALLALIGITYGLTARLGPVALEWQEPGLRLDVADFLRVIPGPIGRVRPARPARVRRPAAPAPPPGAAQDASPPARADAARYAPPAARRPGRAETLLPWTFTAAIATIYLPLAPVLAAINLRHGADPRLPVHAMALAGIYVLLERAGTFEHLAALALS